MPSGTVAEGRTEQRGAGREKAAGSLGDELRNGLAFSLLAAVYALMMAGLFRLVPPAPLPALLGAFCLGYALAALVFLMVQAAAWALTRLLVPRYGGGLLPLAAPLACLLVSAAAVPHLLQARDLAEVVGVAAFLGAGLALSAAHGFYGEFQRRLVPARRVRDFLADRPALSGRVRRSIEPLLVLGRLAPWMIGGLALLALPPALRDRAAAYLIVLTLLVHLLNRKLLEELAVWVFLHALREGDYLLAARLPIRPSRLATEIEPAPLDLEAPFARFIDYGMHGPEGLALAPAALGRLVRVHLSAYGLARGQGSGVRDQEDCFSGRRASLGDDQPSLVRRLLERGVRFRVEAEPSTALEPLLLPPWSELFRAAGRARLAALYPDEPLWRVIARLYETPIRGLLLLPSLLWLPLLGVTLALAGSGLWVLPLAGAALSFALLAWLTLFYGNWIFDQSLRRRDFEFLARQLGAGKMHGELEDALGAGDPLVRDRAVELLLFNDSIARLGITVPPAGLRKFLRRATK